MLVMLLPNTKTVYLSDKLAYGDIYTNIQVIFNIINLWLSMDYPVHSNLMISIEHILY